MPQPRTPSITLQRLLTPFHHLLTPSITRVFSGAAGTLETISIADLSASLGVDIEAVNAPKVARHVVFRGDTAEAQTFTIPAGVIEMEVKVWGAAGGSGACAGNDGVGRGGSGAYVSATVAASPGEMLKIVVGQGGLSFSAASTAFGGGGNSKLSDQTCGSPHYCGAGGGGLSGIFSCAPRVELSHISA